MTITLNGTNGVVTPGVQNTAAETIATTLGVTGAATVGGSLGVTGAATAASLQVGGVATNVYPLVSGTAVTCAGQTSINFTSIPSWVKRITVMFNGVSLSGTSNYLVQLGTSSGVVTTGYVSSGFGYGAAVSSTAGHVVQSGSAARLTSAIVTITNITSNTWVGAAVYGADTATSGGGVTTMNIALSGTLDRVTITTVNGIDTFDTTPSAGSINIMYE